jgi:hypothetical protein
MRLVTAYADPGITEIHVISVVGVALDFVVVCARELVRELSPLTMYAFGGKRARTVKKVNRLEGRPRTLDP